MMAPDRVEAPMTDNPQPESTGLTRVGVAIDTDLLERFDAWIAERGGGNRSEAIRDLIRDRLIGMEIPDAADVVASVSIVFDHHRPVLARGLIDLQHEHGDRVVSALHVHTDRDRCLEVIVLRGPAAEVRRLGERLIGERGVIHGGMFVTRRLDAGPHACAHDHAHAHAHAHAHDHDERESGSARRAPGPRRRGSPPSPRK
jgi:CopG family nickel-responsive transcriptional regulator